MAPRQLWKTTIIIWSKWDPSTTPVSTLAKEGEDGGAYISKAHSELVSNPYDQEDGPSESFFVEMGNDEDN